MVGYLRPYNPMDQYFKFLKNCLGIYNFYKIPIQVIYLFVNWNCLFVIESWKIFMFIRYGIS